MLGSSRGSGTVIAVLFFWFGGTGFAGSLLVVNFRAFTATSSAAASAAVIGFPWIFISSRGWSLVPWIVRRTAIVVQPGCTTALHVSWRHCHCYSILVIRVVVKRFIVPIGRSNISVLRYLFITFVQVTMIR